MRAPRVLRTTAFRLTLLFLGLFAAVASAFLAYLYIATAGRLTREADGDVRSELRTLEVLYRPGALGDLRASLKARDAAHDGVVYRLERASGAWMAGNLGAIPASAAAKPGIPVNFELTGSDAQGRPTPGPARGQMDLLPGGERLFVGVDLGPSASHVNEIVRALWGAGVLVLILGSMGGVLVSRDVSRAIGGLSGVIDQARRGDLSARAKVRGAGDEHDELARGLNDMLDRLERSVAGLRHAGDAIAHDLRSPLTRLRARLEAAIIDVEAGRVDAREALNQALEDADGVLRTFTAVLAIARLDSAVEPPAQTAFDPAELAAGVAELYQPVCEEKPLDFALECQSGLRVAGARDVIAQALANLIDNAIKYTPAGGAVMVRVRRRTSGEIELSVTDTGSGIAEADRARVVDRFVRLENSRNAPGAGLGLSLVAAVARAHGGRLDLDEGPGAAEGAGPGLRAALVIPAAA
ncbi:MAG: HAMP domain-containing protein [Caulobacteraceae bacterium]|nr:HAMP domain-containing protein [Caulobacteraceae bacterium]